MSIIVHSMEAPATMAWQQGALAIRFEDPAYIRAEQVLIDAASRRVGVVFELGYHDLGVLPEGGDLAVLREARLTGAAAGLLLRAPVKIIQ